jgi:hypothetical protein
LTCFNEYVIIITCQNEPTNQVSAVGREDLDFLPEKGKVQTFLLAGESAAELGLFQKCNNAPF